MNMDAGKPRWVRQGENVRRAQKTDEAEVTALPVRNPGTSTGKLVWYLCASPFVGQCHLHYEDSAAAAHRHGVSEPKWCLSDNVSNQKNHSLQNASQRPPRGQPSLKQRRKMKPFGPVQGNVTDSVARCPTQAKDTKTHILNLSLSRSPYPSPSVERVKTLTWHITATEQTATSSRTKLPANRARLSHEVLSRLPLACPRPRMLDSP